MSEDKATVIANLQEQITIYNAQLASMEAQSPLDVTTYTAIRAERDEAQKKLDALNAEITAGIEAQTLVSSQFESIMIGNEPVSLRDLTMGEDAYQIVSIWIQQYVGDMAQAHAAIVQSYESQVAKLQVDVSELDEAREQLADMTAKRDAAATELAEAQEEKKRLATDNESLRKQLETSNKPSQTNLTTSAAELVAQWKASKPAVYDVVDMPNGNRSAKLLETDEAVVWEKIYPGKYRIATAEEVERFRESQTQPVAVVEPTSEEAQESVVPTSELVEPPPSIPSETDVPTIGLDANPSLRQDDEAITYGEFKALEARVAMLELGRSAVA